MQTQTHFLSRLRDAIAPVRQRLEFHPLYTQIKTVRHVRLFMEAHVFAVWDFMSLLKSLQAQLTCVATPWLPSAYSQSCRLINEIVLGEESDTFGDGYSSHFEVYLQAMKEMGADTTSIRAFTALLADRQPVEQALNGTSIPAEAVEFVRSTFALLGKNKTHVTAAAFTFGREDLIPDMFHGMVKDLRQHFEGAGLFEYYLDRHIEVDGDSHGPMALQMVEELCGEDESKWQEAETAAADALNARVALWDGILQRVLLSS